MKNFEKNKYIGHKITCGCGWTFLTLVNGALSKPVEHPNQLAKGGTDASLDACLTKYRSHARGKDGGFTTHPISDVSDLRATARQWGRLSRLHQAGKLKAY